MQLAFSFQEKVPDPILAPKISCRDVQVNNPVFLAYSLKIRSNRVLHWQFCELLICNLFSYDTSKPFSRGAYNDTRHGISLLTVSKVVH